MEREDLGNRLPGMTTPLPPPRPREGLGRDSRQDFFHLPPAASLRLALSVPLAGFPPGGPW